jgi:hypothetical protein
MTQSRTHPNSSPTICCSAPVDKDLAIVLGHDQVPRVLAGLHAHEGGQNAVCGEHLGLVLGRRFSVRKQGVVSLYESRAACHVLIV